MSFTHPAAAAAAGFDVTQSATLRAKRATLNFSFEQTEMLRDLIKSECSAYHNWIASAVESGQTERANELVAKLRRHERMYAECNRTLRELTEEHEAKLAKMDKPI